MYCIVPPPVQYAADPEPIVADSCIVALDMLEFEQSGGFQYADDGAAVTAAAAAPAPVTASA
jgi:deoxyhypusine monooxygenase